ncbi:hypothetical protein Hypma_005226 [Hypsizygus marmoreus]|uniref:Uncharacterized protein n=1 Tax=Hypsizygus marmoreus TaxID=39966 RepID=A0A369J384_HYPMA|nr:hypothetical protein Hypma_005226 [Hypsizygus marmoreus]
MWVMLASEVLTDRQLHGQNQLGYYYDTDTGLQVLKLPGLSDFDEEDADFKYEGEEEIRESPSCEELYRCRHNCDGRD